MRHDPPKPGDVIHGAEHPVEVGPFSRRDSIRPGLYLTAPGGAVHFAKAAPKPSPMEEQSRLLELATQKLAEVRKALAACKRP